MPHACNWKVYLDSTTGQIKGPFTLHACVRGQDASCEHAVVLHFSELTVAFFHENVY